MSNNPFALTTHNSYTPTVSYPWGGMYESQNALSTTKRSNAAIVQRGAQALVREKCRSTLAFAALEDLAVLSAMATQAYRSNPFAEEDYRRIVSSYAAGAAMRIMSF